jgi:Secretion system C-terminal sorting domain/FG-GAP-like repeat
MHVASETLATGVLKEHNMKKYLSVLGCWLVLCLSLQAQVIDFYDPVVVFDEQAEMLGINHGDIDGDGIKELIYLRVNGTGVGLDSTVILKRTMNGNYSFHSALKLNYGDLKIADMNNDGFNDLILTDLYDLGVMINKGTGAFNPVVYYHIGGGSQELSVADLNNDGYLDVVAPTTHELDPTYFFNTVFLNNKNGTLATGIKYVYPTVYPNKPISGFYVSVLDMNNDGYKDIVNPFGGKDSLLIYLNKSDGTFNVPTRFVFPKQATHTEVLDLDHDGKEDLACFTYDPIQGQAKVLYSKVFYLQKAVLDDNRLETTVVDSIVGAGDFRLADVNNDGEYDMIFHEEYLLGGPPDYPKTDSVVIYLNKGNLTFDLKKKSYSKRHPSTYLTIEDYNNDGLKDFLMVFYTTNSSAINIMYRKAVINGIEKAIGSSQLSVYPNPSTGLVTISSLNQAIQRVVVYDVMGRPAMEHYDVQLQNLSLDLNKLSKGLYHLQVELLDGSTAKQHLVLE